MGKIICNSCPLSLGDQGQALPPPHDFPVFLAQAEKFARGFGRVGNQFQDLGTIFGRSGRSFKIPVEVGLFEGRDGDMANGEVGCPAKIAPRVRRQQAMMAGVAQFFQRVRPGFGFRMAVRDGAVNQEKEPAGLQYAGGFPDKTLRRTEMMRRDAAGHQVESRVRVGELFGGVQAGLHGEAALGGGAGGAIEHGLGKVREGDVESEAGQIKPGVAGAGGEIERPGSRRQLHCVKRLANVLDVFKNVATAIAVALPGELFLRRALNVIQFHAGNISRMVGTGNPRSAAGGAKQKGRPHQRPTLLTSIRQPHSRLSRAQTAAGAPRLQHFARLQAAGVSRWKSMMATAAVAARAGFEVAFLGHAPEFKGFAHVAGDGLLQFLHFLLGIEEAAGDGVVEEGFALGLKGGDLALAQLDARVLLFMKRLPLVHEGLVLTAGLVVGHEGFDVLAQGADTRLLQDDAAEFLGFLDDCGIFDLSLHNMSVYLRRRFGLVKPAA